METTTASDSESVLRACRYIDTSSDAKRLLLRGR